jgi:diguanylate cyclase (GGDEF)-like protein
MERLVDFGEALGRSLDMDAIRDVAAQHLHRLAGSENAWAMARVGDDWQALISTARETRAEVERSHEAVADLVLAVHQADGTLGPRMTHGHYCVPMTAGGRIVGIVGSPESDAPSESRQRMLAMSAALLGISLRNAQLFREVQESSVRDGLTGCYNRTHTVELVEIELKRARRSRAPLSLMMFDIDHFKKLNDRYGHLGGDAVLMAVGKRLRQLLRGSDVKCRYGGEEFLVLLPETPLDGAHRVAETLRREFEDMRVSHRGEELAITASFGVTSALPLEADSQAIIGRADRALYRAKEQGRNCVQLAGPESAVA